MYNKFLIGFLLTLFVFIFIGCNKETEEYIDLYVPTNEINLYQEGGSVTVNIIANELCSVTVPSSDTWVKWSNSDVETKGVFELRFTIEPNEYINERSSTITVTNHAGKNSSSFVINQSGTGGAPIERFAFEAALNKVNLMEDAIGNIKDGIIEVNIPYLADVESLIPTITGNFSSAEIGGVDFVEGKTAADFTAIVPLLINYENDHKLYTIKVKVFNGLPIVRINTNDQPILNKNDYVNGDVSISKTTDYETGFSGSMKIRFRGNYTSTLPKKPYRIKLDEKSEILGMPSNKDWVLLANYSDKSLLRTATAFELSRLTGMTWTPRMKYVDVFLNNKYIGQYLLGEHVKAGSDRLPIDDGGVFGERDGYYMLEDYWIKSSMNYPYTFKEPDPANAVNTAPLIDKINLMEAKLLAGDKDPVTGYQQYIDLNSFAKWYLITEFLANLDGNFYIYMKTQSGPLEMGPIWDYDWSMGNTATEWGSVNTISPKGFQASTIYPYFKNGIASDPEFKREVKELWAKMKGDLPQLYDFINENAQLIRQSANSNFECWNIFNSVGVTRLERWENEVQFIKDYLNKRADWLDSQISTW